jgi:competence protein ComEA
MFDLTGIDRGRALMYLLIGAAVLIVGLVTLRSDPSDPEVIPARPAGESGSPLAVASRSMVIDVSGEVRNPGVYRFEPGSRVIDAIERAGGPTNRAYPAGLNRAALLVDGQQVVLPGASRPGAVGSAPGMDSPLSLGMATAADLEQIDGIGPVTAGKIIEFRDSKGGLASVDDLDQIPGIGPATMETLRSAVQP